MTIDLRRASIVRFLCQSAPFLGALDSSDRDNAAGPEPGAGGAGGTGGAGGWGAGFREWTRPF